VVSRSRPSSLHAAAHRAPGDHPARERQMAIRFMLGAPRWSCSNRHYVEGGPYSPDCIDSGDSAHDRNDAPISTGLS
jgi:hypothetical protein